MRLTINISEDLLALADERAKALFVSRSAYIAMALSQKMNFDDVLQKRVSLPSVNDPKAVNGYKRGARSAARSAARSDGAGESGTAPACPLAGDR